MYDPNHDLNSYHPHTHLWQATHKNNCHHGPQSYSPMPRIELEQTLCMVITVFFGILKRIVLANPQHINPPAFPKWHILVTVANLRQNSPTRMSVILMKLRGFLMHLGNLILISTWSVRWFWWKKLGYPAVLRVSIQHQALQCPEFVKKLAEGVEGEKTSLKKAGLIQFFLSPQIFNLRP